MSAGICTSQGWCLEDPALPGDALVAVLAFNNHDIVAVAQGSTAEQLIFRLQGGQWHGERGPPGLAIAALSAASPTDMWAVGYDDAAHWDGVAWSVVHPVPGKSYARAVYQVGPGEVWVGGNDGLAHLHNGAWVAGPTRPVQAIHGTARDNVFAVAGNTIMHFDGMTWTTVEPGTTTNLSAVWAVGDEAWASAYNVLFHFHDGAWEAVQGQEIPQQMWGTTPGSLWGLSQNRVVRYTGTSWVRVPGAPTGPWTTLHGVSDEEVVVVGPKTTAARWNGMAWQTLTGAPNVNYRATVKVIRGNQAVAVGDHDIRVLDGGWRKVPLPTGETNLNTSAVVDTDDIWFANAERIWHLAGTTWTQVPTPDNRGAFDLAASATDAWAIGSQGDILHSSMFGAFQVVPPPAEENSISHSAHLMMTDDGTVFYLSYGGDAYRWNGSAFVVSGAPNGVAKGFGRSATDVYFRTRNGFVHFNGTDAEDTKAELMASTDTVVTAIAPDIRGGVLVASGPHVMEQVGDSRTFHDTLLGELTSVGRLSTGKILVTGKHGTIWSHAPWPVPGTQPAVSISPDCSSDGCCVVSPVTTGSALRAVHAGSPEDVVAVGDRGVIMEFNGQRWASSNSGTRVNILSVAVVAGGDAWAGLEDGSFLRRRAGTWNPVPGATTGAVNGISAVSATSIFAVSGTSLVHWDGLAWTVVGDVGPADALSVWAASGTDVWVANGYGLSHFDGMAIEPGPPGPFRQVTGRSPTDAWAWRALGGPDALLLHYDGMAWEPVRVPEEARRLKTLFAVGDGDVFLVGNNTWVGPVAFRLRQGTWTATLFNLPDSDGFLAVGGSSDDVWVVGEHGALIRARQDTWKMLHEPRLRTGAHIWRAAPNDLWINSEPMLHLDSTGIHSVKGADGGGRGDIWGSSPSDIWSGGDGFGRMGHYDGTRWNTVMGPRFVAQLWGSGPNDIYATTPINTGQGLSHYDGMTWARVGGVPVEPSFVDGWSGSDVWAAARSQVFHWNGSQWSNRTPQGVVAANEVLATGADEAFLLEGPNVRHFKDGSWSTEVLPTGASYATGRAWSTTDVVVGGGTMAHWDGNTWRPIDIGSAATLGVRSIAGESGRDFHFSAGRALFRCVRP